MSKSTQRYGNITFQARTGAIWPAKVPDKVKAEWAELDRIAQLEFGKEYRLLTDQQKTSLHYNKNIGKYETKSTTKTGE